MRVLCIASYLRCLFAAIEYAPTEEMKESAIEQISDDVRMRELTQLCDTTGWLSKDHDLDANIGAKYLRLMRHVI